MMVNCRRRIRSRVLALLFLGAVASVIQAARGADVDFRTEEIDRSLTVGYAVQLVDMNDDRRPDILVVDSNRLIWFENPAWKAHPFLEGATKRDNVTVAPYDIDGDGRVDLALGADWRPADTSHSGSIQWATRGTSSGDWQVHPIGVEPTVHRVRWVDLENDGRAELVVAPLFGRGSKGPHFAESAVRLLAYRIPVDPVAGPWTPETLNESLHVSHNFWPTDFDGDQRTDLLVASFEGVSLLSPPLPDAAGKTLLSGWSRRTIGAGNQATTPNRGASEIKLGRLANGGRYLATIEPWHGFQVVVYTAPAVGAASGLWERHVLDDELAWGHAVWCANLDDDADEELIIGVRDNKSDASRSGIRIFDPQDPAGKTWRRQLVDPAGVAVEDAIAGDLDGDGKQDLIAVGRATHNVRIYWNRGK